MRKLYSLVLIAAGLLIGTNSWAATVTEASQLQSAINNAADGEEIVLQSAYSFFDNNSSLWLGTGKKVILNLNGLKYQYNGSNATHVAFAVTHGTLEIKNGKIQGSNLEDLIRVYGTTESINAEANSGNNAYARVIVDEDVELISSNNVFSIDVMRDGQPALFGQSGIDYVNCAKDANKNGLANGARIDVYGKISAQKYGIKVNGKVRDPQEYGSDRNYSPYVFIASTGYVSTNATATKAVAAYSSGYARWQVEGYCGGSTGLYVKSGQVVLENAVITSTNSAATQPVGKGSGVDAGGSAIVMESNSAYAGNMSVTIKGNTEVSATAGYAIEEKITTAANTEVETIKIEGGTISGGNKGAVIVENQSTGKVAIAGGNIAGNVQVEGESTPENPSGVTTIDLTNSTQTSALGMDVEPSTTVNAGGKTIVVVGATSPASYTVTLNAEGLATFSAIEAVTLPEGLTAYKAGALNNNELALSPIGVGGSVIPAATGVILYGTANAPYTLTVGGTANAISENNLKPAVAWVANNAGKAYILHGNELYLYTGLKMKANKAFLLLPANTTVVDPEDPNAVPAPARISLRFAETEETTAVENVAPEAVKAVKFVGNDGKLYIRRGEAVYTVQGQLVK